MLIEECYETAIVSRFQQMRHFVNNDIPTILVDFLALLII